MTEATPRYKVGETTDFGVLLAEAVSWEYTNQIVSMYRETDTTSKQDKEFEQAEECYVIRIWDKTDEGIEFEADSHVSDEYEPAMTNFLQLAFNVSI